MLQTFAPDARRCGKGVCLAGVLLISLSLGSCTRSNGAPPSVVIQIYGKGNEFTGEFLGQTTRTLGDDHTEFVDGIRISGRTSREAHRIEQILMFRDMPQGAEVMGYLVASPGTPFEKHSLLKVADKVIIMSSPLR